MSRNDSSAFSAASALVALESLTNSTRPSRPTCSMRWARPGNEAMAARDLFGAQAQRARRGEGEGGVLAVVRAAQRRRVAKIDERRVAVARDDEAIVDPDVGRAATARRRSRRRAAPASASRAAVARRSRGTVRRRRRSARRRRARDQALLDRGVVFQRPVPVEMIGRDVDQRADARLERRREIDLERRAFDDVDARASPAAADRGSARRCCRPSRRRARAWRRIWAISAVVVDLPLVPVIGDERRVAARARRARARRARCRR